jgi:Ca-activated chloride channel family protein
MRATSLWLHVFGGGLALCQVPEPREYRLVSEVRLVVLDVSVRDGSGRPVAGLAREAFRILDSHRPQPITAFAAEDAPVTIGIVLDASRSMRIQRSETVTAALALVSGSRTDDEMFLVTFNDNVTVGSPGAPDALRRRIEDTPCEGRTALYDGIAAALGQLSRGARERKALVIISDGADTASRLTRTGVLRQVQLAHATIYAIGMTGESAADSNAGFLSDIARTSGGGAYLDVPTGQLTEVCERIAREIRSRYMLGFHAAETRKTETRPLRVEVDAPDRGRLKVLSRRSYVAFPSGGLQP